VVLTGKQRRFLRARGHGLHATVQVGKEGITDAVVAAVEQALLDHELVKVKLGQNALLDRRAAADELAGRVSAEVAQVLGNTVLLYRANPDEPVLRLPAGSPPQS
jgi:RNA-binding protein